MLALISDLAAKRQMSLLLSSHLLRDVERVCERVTVIDQGKIAMAGNIADLTGTRREVFEVRFNRTRQPPSDGSTQGEDNEAFLTDFKDAGGDWRELEDGYRLFMSKGMQPAELFGIASESGVQIRHLRPGTQSLEDVFLRALGHEAED